ncbi:hypothetical protein O6H91_03G012500 [Diphasiastrum complanatum]|uniref:Uncharacterized protein n=1 Tax=Diphasiastrum complanatum TaxID=34168 RepID=A0ACC2E3E7_DIPCM|nr:hypothetical protein O6H91_03G012500 [Diphasiastrum complanatum]
MFPTHSQGWERVFRVADKKFSFCVPDQKHFWQGPYMPLARKTCPLPPPNPIQPSSDNFPIQLTQSESRVRRLWGYWPGAIRFELARPGPVFCCNVDTCRGCWKKFEIFKSFVALSIQLIHFTYDIINVMPN